MNKFKSDDVFAPVSFGGGGGERRCEASGSFFGNAIRIAFAFLFWSLPAMADNLPAPAQDSDFRSHDGAIVDLGKSLFFDKELSGNRNISCATCHSPLIGTVDGLSMNIGTGGHGLGVLRSAGQYPPNIKDPQSRGARNTTPLFNLGHASLDVLFWDGRVDLYRIAHFR